MSKTRNVILTMLIAILCVAIGFAAFLTFGGATAAETTEEIVHNHSWSHEDATELTAQGGTITDNYVVLNEDLTLTCNLTITGSVELCLNGHTLTGLNSDNDQANSKDDNTDNPVQGGEKDNFGKTYYSVITVKSGAAFTLYDCDERSATGTITGGETEHGGGVLVDGTFTMYGGTISGNHAKYPAGIDGGSPNGGGVYVSGKFIMNGGSIENNMADSHGDGVYVGYSSSFTMNGGTVSDNSGDGVYVYYSSSFTMNGGTVSGNTGDGVFVHSYNVYFGIFNMTGGLITGNTGRGVYIYGSMSAMEEKKEQEDSDWITDERKSSTLSASMRIASGMFNVSGSPTVSGNTVSNVYLYNSKVIVTDTLTQGARIGVTVAGASTATFTSGYKAANDGVKPSQYFFADDGSCVYLNDEEAVLGKHAELSEEWTTGSVGDATSPRTQVRLCVECGRPSEMRELVLTKIDVTADNQYTEKDATLTNVKVTAHFKLADGDGTEEYSYVITSGYVINYNFANGKHFTPDDKSVEITYTVGGETVTATVEITVNALPDNSEDSGNSTEKPTTPDNSKDDNSSKKVDLTWLLILLIIINVVEILALIIAIAKKSKKKKANKK